MELRLGVVKITFEVERKIFYSKRKISYRREKRENNNSNIFVAKNSTEHISNVLLFPNR